MKFLPIKIQSDEFAKKLYEDGEVYMRSLHEFGSWGVFDQDEVLKNNYRADLFSGVTEVFASPEDSDLLRHSPDILKQRMKNCCYIDNGSPQYFKIYSLYCWDFENGQFQPVDERMRQFGDTAVIITNFQEFLRRVGYKLIDLFDPVSIMCDRMEFFDFSKTQAINPIFYKYAGQAYQKELRIAACQLQEGVNPQRALKKDFSPVKFQIGAIDDITRIVPTDDLISGKVEINGDEIVWPSSEVTDKSTNYDKAVAFTKAQMNIYRSSSVKPMFSLQ